LKKYQEAIADYTRAIALDPKDPDGYRRRALAHTMAGDSQNAAADFRALLKIKPDDADAQSRLKALETRGNSSPAPGGLTPAPAGPAPVATPGVSPALAPPGASPH
jgi:predicted TPR repeat methyltransferase